MAALRRAASPASFLKSVKSKSAMAIVITTGFENRHPSTGLALASCIKRDHCTALRAVRIPSMTGTIFRRVMVRIERHSQTESCEITTGRGKQAADHRLSYDIHHNSQVLHCVRTTQPSMTNMENASNTRIYCVRSRCG